MTALSPSEGLWTTFERGFLHVLFGISLCFGLLCAAQGEEYPSRVVRIIVPYTAGSPNDLLARVISQELQSRLGQPFVVENKPGGGTSIGTKVFATSAADGYTLLFSSSSLIVDPILNHREDLSFAKEFTPVATIATTPWLLATSPRLPAKTLKEFIAYVRAHSGMVNFGFAQGTAAQLVGDRFKVLTNANILDVPYKGGSEAISDFLGGRIQMLTPTPSTSLSFIRSGQMLALATTNDTRIMNLPDVPTFRESGLPGLTLEFWAGVFAPNDTSSVIIKRLNAAINAALRSERIKDEMNKLGFAPKGGAPEELTRLIAEEIPRWTEIVNSTAADSR
jgi:tripartite-type tricarboxylate transporter receptor subunit TctC